MGDAHHDIYDNALWPTIYHDDDDDDDDNIIHACVLTQIDEMREKEEGKWVTQMEMIGPRERHTERERERGSLPFRAKGSRRGTHPRLFFAPKHPNFTVILGRREWRVYKKEQVSATCWAVNDDKTPSPPHANSIVSVCLSLSLSLSAIAWKAPPLPHCNFICPFLFFSFFSFLSLWIWNWNGRHKWKVMTWLWVLLILQ